MKKQAFTAAFIAVLIVTAIAGSQSADSVRAQTDAAAEPPVITVLSPENYTCITNNITLSFRVDVGKDLVYGVLGVRLSMVYYKGDWQRNETVVYERDVSQVSELYSSASFSLNLTGVPDGNHNITFYAREIVWTVFSNSPVYYESFSSANFTVDSVPPSVSVLSPQSSWYTTDDVLLSFTVSEGPSRVAYSLDDNDNVTVSGNSTLFSLSAGAHNITVYAWDIAGNVGTSEAVYFTVAEPFLLALIVVALVSVVAVGVLAGILLYFKRRKQKMNPPQTN